MFKDAVVMKNIVKRYGNFAANDHINLSVRCGEVHALLGENGSGKTTLMSILYGLKPMDEGEIYLFGEKVHLTSPIVAMQHGIGMVHQHFMLIPTFTVLQNIILGHEPVHKLNRVDYDTARKKIQDLMEQYQLFVDLDARISQLSVNVQQRVEILKALYTGAKILILDEPTAALTPEEIDSLFQIVKGFRAAGLAVIIVTHKLKEIQQMADRCTVIRRGQVIDCFPVENVTEEELASKMVGRPVLLRLDKTEKTPGEVLFKIDHLSALDYRGIKVLDDISFDVRAGEIVGIAGVEGNGLDELAEVIPAVQKHSAGTITLQDQTFNTSNPQKMIEAGLANIPADRHKHGLILDFSIGENLVLKDISQNYAHKGVIDHDKIYNKAEEMIQRFDIRTPSGDGEATARSLSGGNQQKVIIAREVNSPARILLAVNPSRGLDVGAIEFVQRAILEQRENDKAIILISYELSEILNLCDRILVMFRGKIVGHLTVAEADERTIGLLMTGGRIHA